MALLLAAMLSMQAATPLAAVVDRLYSVVVPVADRSDSARQAAVAAAFNSLVVRLTGRVSAPNEPAIARLRGRADEFVAQFAYRSAKPEARLLPAISTDPAAPAVNGSLELEVSFEATSLAAALRDSGQTIWGKERPAVLVWWRVSNGPATRVISSADPDALRQRVERQSLLRGLPVVFPLGDLADAAADAALGSVLDIDVLEGLRERYRAEGVIVAELPGLAGDSNTSTPFAVEVSLYQGGNTLVSQQQGNLPEVAVNAAVDWTFERLAERYAAVVNAYGTGELELRVNGVDRVDDYARVSRYLGSIDIVQQLQLVSVAPGELQFVVVASGGKAALDQVIGLGTTLVPDLDGYRLLPR